MTSPPVGMHCFVSGVVQGVFFRASTHREASQLGVQVQADNLDDGRVEVIAMGSAENLEKLKDWLCKGPDYARVDEVTCESLTEAEVNELLKSRLLG